MTHRLLALAFGLLMFSGCASSRDPNLITGHAWHGGLINMEARKIDAATYAIEARGAGACSIEQVRQAWVEMADRVAAGGKYSKENSVSTYEYDGPGPFVTTRHVGVKIVGKIVLE